MKVLNLYSPLQELHVVFKPGTHEVSISIAFL